MVHLGSLVTTAVDSTVGRRSGWRALWRLLPYARPHLGRLVLAGGSGILKNLRGDVLTLRERTVIDLPIHRNTSS